MGNSKKPYSKYLAYGSNLHPIRLGERVPSARFVQVVKLKKYKLSFHKLSMDKSGKCNCFYTGREDDFLLGAIYELKSSEVAALDKAEGLGKGYNKEVITLPYNGTDIKVFTYSADLKFVDDNLVPYDWYKQLVLYGAKYHNFPHQYVEGINSVKAIKDMKDSRSKENFNIIEKMKKR